MAQQQQQQQQQHAEKSQQRGERKIGKAAGICNGDLRRKTPPGSLLPRCFSRTWRSILCRRGFFISFGNLAFATIIDQTMVTNSLYLLKNKGKSIIIHVVTL